MPSLHDLAHEAVLRLGDRPLPLPGTAPHLLAWQEGRALLRTARGLEEASFPPGSEPFFDLAPLLDHTLLQAGATQRMIEAHCEEAARFGFATVCVNPLWVSRASALLRGSPVRVCTVTGFPLGATPSSQMARETASALEEGAQEVDMVLPLGLALGGDWKAVATAMAEVRGAVSRGQAILKVILETCLLNESQKIQACLLAREAGLDFVKTSTGFSTGGATVEDVALLRATVGAACGVKASGGIRTYEAALRMVQAGATRLGVSASLAVARGVDSPSSGY